VPTQNLQSWHSYSCQEEHWLLLCLDVLYVVVNPHEGMRGHVQCPHIYSIVLANPRIKFVALVDLQTKNMSTLFDGGRMMI